MIFELAIPLAIEKRMNIIEMKKKIESPQKIDKTAKIDLEQKHLHYKKLHKKRSECMKEAELPKKFFLWELSRQKSRDKNLKYPKIFSLQNTGPD